MKTSWIVALLCLLSIVAYTRIAGALGAAAEPLAATRVASSMPAPLATRNGGNSAVNLAAYVHMHETRNADYPFQSAVRTSACH